MRKSREAVATGPAFAPRGASAVALWAMADMSAGSSFRKFASLINESQLVPPGGRYPNLASEIFAISEAAINPSSLLQSYAEKVHGPFFESLAFAFIFRKFLTYSNLSRNFSVVKSEIKKVRKTANKMLNIKNLDTFVPR